MNRRRNPVRSKRQIRSQRSPSFDSGVFPEPRIALGGQHFHVDPKTGLSLYGPYSLSGQKEPFLSRITVGIVGPPAMVADAEQWLDACKGVLTNDGTEPFLRPHFPGFNRESALQCDLVFGDTWRETIRQSELTLALEESDSHLRIKKVIDLYARAIEVLANREPRPHVVLCCFPQGVIDRCTAFGVQSRRTKKTRLTKQQRRVIEDANRGQRSLFSDMTPRFGIEDEVQGHQNLRRGLKAVTMQFGLPTQIVWPRTLQLTETATPVGGRALQDCATRAWNFTTALYHKAGGSPWRLDGLDQDVCFVGVSFFREVMQQDARLRTSMAQAFTAAGDGYVLRGNSFEWSATRSEKSPHLDRKSAAALMRDVLELYQRQNRQRLPGRIVVHKTSRFTDEELEGFEDACSIVPKRDLVAFGYRGIQFYRTGDYPPVRGAYVKFSDSDFLLYTDGYIPYLRTYPGARVPRPLEVVQHYGDSPWNVVLQEILALTKMNWNTADFSCSKPITIAFSRKVGEILAELPPDLPLRPEYRYYM